ncbi:CHAT domain-containing protein [Mycena rosella]|uniref:CHAT domain-containing protein n=1 Tax=Mycena rosella TaxID=1033263 RepID=A0AAD7GLB3_MYCRO|nr:CHAT domain-containing protein [Mycena rosella]
MIKIIHLQNVHIKSLTNPHDDLPEDAPMFAQIIIDGTIFLQTVLVESAESHTWKLDFECEIPPAIPIFSFALLRFSKTAGIRLLGSLEIRRGQVLNCVRAKMGEVIDNLLWNQPFIIQNVVFDRRLNRVNPNGPLLQFTAEFSVSVAAPIESSFIQVDNLDGSAYRASPSDQFSTVGTVKHHGIESDLQQMHNTMETQDFLELWVMHERILLLSHSNKNRPRYLYFLGDIFLGHYKISWAMEVLNQAICAYSDAVRDEPGSAIWSAALGSALSQRFERLGNIVDLNQSVSKLEAAVEAIPNDHPTRVALLNNTGNALLSRFERLGELSDLNRSILRFKATIALTHDGNPAKPTLFSNLGDSLLSRYQRLGELTDVDQAVVMFETAVALTAEGHPDKPLYLSRLGRSLLRRFEQVGDPTDINRSVVMLEATVKFTPDNHPHRASRLGNLGDSLLRRYEQLGALADIDRSIVVFETAAGITQNGQLQKASCLNHLGQSRLRRYERFGNLTDVDQAVEMLKAAIELTPDDHPNKHAPLNNLGKSLLCRYEQLGELTDMHQAVAMFEAAVGCTPDDDPTKPVGLNNLGGAFFRRFERLGNLSDLNQSMQLFEAAVRLVPEGHQNKPAWLKNLADSHLMRFKRIGERRDISQAVDMFEAAVRLTPEGHPDKPSYLIRLADSLDDRFVRFGDLTDLDKSAAMLEAAVGLTPDDHPDKILFMGHLSNSLLHRFQRLGDLSDIKRSVSVLESAVALTPSSHSALPVQLNSLGISLRHLFERLGNLTDLDRSVKVLEAAVALTPNDHPSKHSRLNNLGSSLICRFELLGDPADIAQASAMLGIAVKLIPEGDPERASAITNFANCFFRRFQQLDDITDIDNAVFLWQTSLELTPDGHRDKPSRLINLAGSLLHRFEQLGHPDDFNKMILHLTCAASAPTAPAHMRFSASTQWAQHAHIHHHQSILCAYGTAIDRLQELAWLGLSISDRHYQILLAGRVVREAASAAIEAHEYTKAVEWLDQGRSIIWGQVLSLRTPIDDLRKAHPELAEELISLSNQLETAGLRSSEVEEPDGSLNPQECHALAHRREQVVKQIRNLTGFESFLLPKKISELSLAAQIGPVVLSNISRYRCDALILMPDAGNDLIHVPLLDFTLSMALSLVGSLGSLVQGAVRSDRLDGFREGQMLPEEEFARILSELWIRIVRPVLDGLAFTTPTRDPGRIWWHIRGNEAFGSKLSDFFISSYTPSLTALIEGFRARDESKEGLQILAVAQPSAHRQDYIPGTLEEIDHIKRLAGAQNPVVCLAEGLATVDSVREGMKKSRWAHFACHGVQDIFNPTKSALLLAGDSRLTLSSIIQLSLQNADLAFLSACQTATGAKNLEDESVHLTAGMLLAGYRGVIGTMWSIMDKDGPKVASDVYAHLFKTSPPDSTKAAEALHLAVRNLHEEAGGNKSFAHWVPFIHVGI